MNLKKSALKNNQTVQISGSKSESNRLLVLQKLFGNIEIHNLSNSQDTTVLKNALESDLEVIDIHHAGTAMRFLTSYFAVAKGRKTILTGSERMKNRPIKPLVDALKSLGAEINYLGKEGFPPLEIQGVPLKKNSVEIPAGISSQFISSLLLIGGVLENGLEIELQGKITSLPYLEMTLKILSEIGIQNTFEGNAIKIFKQNNLRGSKQQNYEIESDWSSASYYYALAAIGRKTLSLKSFKKDSLQGDAQLQKIFSEFFGINTVFKEDENLITLIPIENFRYPDSISLDLNSSPDLAQTLCVTASAFKIPFHFSGLETLKIKETDRLMALKNELSKVGCHTEITANSIVSYKFTLPDKKIKIKTYDDHRMAMSFAPYCLLQELEIENPEVVEKSYPDFWKDLSQILV